MAYKVIRLVGFCMLLFCFYGKGTKLFALLLLVGVFWPLATKGQELIFEEYVVPDRYGHFGANMRHFAHVYYDFAVPIAFNENELQTGNSNFASLGLRYKLKLGKYISLGTDVQAGTFTVNRSLSVYEIAEGGFVPDVEQKIQSLDMSAGAFLRLNFGRRGNTIGRFIDFYTHLGKAVTARESIDYQIISDNGIKQDKYLENPGLPYFAGTVPAYGLRVGFNRVVVTALYRPTNYFAQNKGLLLPAWSFGLQLGLH